MTNYNEIIRELRLKKGYSQKQMADRLCITPSAYSKVERSKTLLTLERLGDIAEIFKLTPEELMNYKTDRPMQETNPDVTLELNQLQTKIQESERIVEERNKEIALHKESIMSLIYDAYQRISMEYEEPVPYEKLSHLEWPYLEMLGIKTKEEYEAAGMLVGYVNPENELKVFDELIDDMHIYLLFERGLVNDAWFLKRWEEYKAVGEPKFKLEGNRVVRLNTAPF